MAWSTSSKCCATCANWAGARSVSANHFSYTGSPGDRGKCYANVFCSVTQGPTAMSGGSCPKYQKWAALK